MGSGILSSPKESVYCLSEAPEHLPFDPVEAMPTPCRIATLQPAYFALPELRRLFELAGDDLNGEVPAPGRLKQRPSPSDTRPEPSMTDLSQAHCEACRADAPRISEAELSELMKQIPDWNIEVRNGVMQLEKVFPFKNFAQALDFTNAVAAAAEAEGHHPALLTEWGKVTVTWWSHKLKGLHRNDFIMAARTDAIAAGAPAAAQ